LDLYFIPNQPWKSDEFGELVGTDEEEEQDNPITE
jgi:hypothetical protein